MIVGGSSLIGADSSDSDLDIIFIIPITCLSNEEINKCRECKYNIKQYQKLCRDHDILFGDGEYVNSFLKHLVNVINKARNEEVTNIKLLNSHCIIINFLQNLC